MLSTAGIQIHSNNNKNQKSCLSSSTSPKLAFLLLDWSTWIDVLCCLKRRELATGIQLACRYFKDVIEQSCLATKPRHLISQLNISTIHSRPKRGIGLMARKMLFSSGCLTKRQISTKKFITMKFDRNLWLSFKSSSSSLAKRAKDYNVKQDNKKGSSLPENIINLFEFCQPSTLPPPYIHFQLIYLMIDIFDDDNNDFDVNVHFSMATTSSRMPQILSMLIEQMLPNFDGAQLHIWDPDFNRRKEIWQSWPHGWRGSGCWAQKNDVHALARHFAHPTMRALFAKCGSCYCGILRLPTLSQQWHKEALEEKEESQQQIDGCLLTGSALECDQFIYLSGLFLRGNKYDKPMYTVDEVVQWLHHPISRRQSKERRLGINITVEAFNSNVEINWLAELETELIKKFDHSIISENDNAKVISADLAAGGNSLLSRPSTFIFTLFIITNHFWGASPFQRRLAEDKASGQVLLQAVNMVPLEIASGGWIRENKTPYDAHIKVGMDIDDEDDFCYKHESTYYCVIYSRFIHNCIEHL